MVWERVTSITLSFIVTTLRWYGNGGFGNTRLFSLWATSSVEIGDFAEICRDLLVMTFERSRFTRVRLFYFGDPVVHDALRVRELRIAYVLAGCDCGYQQWITENPSLFIVYCRIFD